MAAFGNSEENKLVVKIPGGFLVVEEKGALDEYPGVWVSVAKDNGAGIPDFGYDDLVACVEYNSSDNVVQTELYRENDDEPIAIVRYPDGCDIMA